MFDYDLVIRNGTIVDGSGADPVVGDVAVIGNRIAAVGRVNGKGFEEIDARHKIVTPGFVDLHTHYDGQVTWEHTLSPSNNHGVTTVVNGNCGVGFAPCRAGDHDVLISVMEGVEDIPEIVMSEGVPWNWESFPEYLDSISDRSFDVDVAMQIPHSPIRVYVMGERGRPGGHSTEDDHAKMAAIVADAVKAGALGVTTSRTTAHRAKNGDPAPSVKTAEDEVLALAKGLRAAGAGVFQMAPDIEADVEANLDLVERIAKTSGRPVSFTVVELPNKPDQWRTILDGVTRLNAQGYEVRAQVCSRPIGFNLGLELSMNPIVTRPSYMEIAHLPLEERLSILHDLSFKEKICSETPIIHPQMLYNIAAANIDRMVEFGDEPNYFPAVDDFLGSRAARLGVSSISLAYDMMLEKDGRNLLYIPAANFATNTPTPVYEMLMHEHTVMSLSDGGAHYGFICDAGQPSFVLSYWARDAAPEHRMPLPKAVNLLTRATAEAVGLLDRGLVASGYKADLNVIDHDNLKLLSPVVKYDLPAGGRRMWQPVEGYEATILNGVITQRDGSATGTLPGRLVRGQRQVLA